jgi:hypothetical protein
MFMALDRREQGVQKPRRVAAADAVKDIKDAAWRAC